MALRGKTSSRLARLSFSVASAMAASVVALGIGGCGDSSGPTSTAATDAQGSTTTQAQSPRDAADFFGATLTSTTAGEPGAVVQSVQPDSKSRLKPGDVIIACNGARVASSDDLARAVSTPKVGEQFTVRVVRGSDRFTLTEVQSPTAYLGASVKEATGGVKGAEVDAIAANGPAAATDLQPGDVITAVDAAPVKGVDDLLQAIGAHGPGDTIKITVSRGSRQLEMTATLATRPAPGSGN